MSETSRTQVVRGADAPTTSFSSQSRTVFPFAGGAHPELFIEHAARGDSAPQHRHPWATWEYVLEGRVRFLADGVEHVLDAGDAIFTPPGVAHTYVVESERAIMVGLNGPETRFYDLQRRAAPIFRADGPPDMGAIMALAAEHQVEVLGPPLSPLTPG